REITPDGVARAIAVAGPLDRARYEAQLARRVIDRIVGFRLAPLLSDAIQRGLSGGRVQSLALRLLVERDQRRRTFVPREAWRVEACLAAGRVRFRAACEVPDAAAAEALAARLRQGAAWVES